MVYLTDQISSREKYYVTLLYSKYIIIFSYIFVVIVVRFLNNFFLDIFFDSHRNKHPGWNIRCFPNHSLREKNFFLISLSLIHPISLSPYVDLQYCIVHALFLLLYMRLCIFASLQNIWFGRLWRYVFFFWSEKTSIRRLLYRCIIFYAHAHTKQTQSSRWYYTDNL